MRWRVVKTAGTCPSPSPRTEQAREFLYPTEYEPPEIPNLPGGAGVESLSQRIDNAESKLHRSKLLLQVDETWEQEIPDTSIAKKDPEQLEGDVSRNATWAIELNGKPADGAAVLNGPVRAGVC